MNLLAVDHRRLRDQQPAFSEVADVMYGFVTHTGDQGTASVRQAKQHQVGPIGKVQVAMVSTLLR